jgi:pimeloyl-ACP methyl ester carboxylesterase
MLYYKTYQNANSNQWVTFIHGAGGSSAIWYKQIKAFKENFNVLLIDLRGHGKSAETSISKIIKSKYTFKDVTKDIIEVLDHLNIEKSHFIGISLGTIIIRTLGELMPNRVDSMIMGGAITRLTFRSRFFVLLGNTFKRVMPYMWLYRLFAWVIMPKKRHAESRNLFINEAKKLCQREFLRWFKLTHEVNPLLRFFREKEIKVPILYIMGSEDYMFLTPVKKMVEHHKNSFLEVIENCGHVVNVEQPDVFNKIAINFIHNRQTMA